MDKYIFLDIDGVLNLIPQGFDEFGAKFHKHFEDNLKSIIEATSAKIVISSSWRHSGLSEMQRMWKERGLAGEVVGITPSHREQLSHIEDFVERAERGNEIQEYIDYHEIKSYVILDDDNDILESQRNNFVRTYKNNSHEDCVDDGYGLTKICSQKAIEILNKIKP